MGHIHQQITRLISLQKYRLRLQLLFQPSLQPDLQPDLQPGHQPSHQPSLQQMHHHLNAAHGEGHVQIKTQMDGVTKAKNCEGPCNGKYIDSKPKPGPTGCCHGVENVANLIMNIVMPIEKTAKTIVVEFGKPSQEDDICCSLFVE